MKAKTWWFIPFGAIYVIWAVVEFWVRRPDGGRGQKVSVLGMVDDALFLVLGIYFVVRGWAGRMKG